MATAVDNSSPQPPPPIEAVHDGEEAVDTHVAEQEPTAQPTDVDQQQEESASQAESVREANDGSILEQSTKAHGGEESAPIPDEAPSDDDGNGEMEMIANVDASPLPQEEGDEEPEPTAPNTSRSPPAAPANEHSNDDAPLTNRATFIVEEDEGHAAHQGKASTSRPPTNRSASNATADANITAASKARPANNTSTAAKQHDELQRILLELKALKAALPTSNEVAMVYSQDAVEGTKLQSYCRGMIRRMQELEKQRRGLAEAGGVEQRRQTIIQKARQRRDAEHMNHVKGFMIKEALRLDKKDEKEELQTEEATVNRQRKEQLAAEAEAKRLQVMADRAARLDDSVAKWREHADRVAAEKEREKERAKAIRAKRAEEVGAHDRLGFLLPNTQASGGAYRAASMRSNRSGLSHSQLSHSHSRVRSNPDAEEEDGNEASRVETTDGTEHQALGEQQRSEAGEGQDDSRLPTQAHQAQPILSREAYEQAERNAKMQQEYALQLKMHDHLRRSELVRMHRKATAKRMTERCASVPAFKEQQAASHEEAYQNQLAKASEEKAQLEEFQQGKQRVLLERIEKNKARQEEAAKRVAEARAADELRLQQMAERQRAKKEGSVARAGNRDDSIKANKGRMKPSPTSSNAAAGNTSTSSNNNAAGAGATPMKMSKLAMKLMERTERVAALYAVAPVAAEPAKPRPAAAVSPSRSAADASSNPSATTTPQKLRGSPTRSGSPKTHKTKAGSISPARNQPMREPSVPVHASAMDGQQPQQNGSRAKADAEEGAPKSSSEIITAGDLPALHIILNIAEELDGADAMPHLAVIACGGGAVVRGQRTAAAANESSSFTHVAEGDDGYDDDHHSDDNGNADYADDHHAEDDGDNTVGPPPPLYALDDATVKDNKALKLLFEVIGKSQYSALGLVADAAGLTSPKKKAAPKPDETGDDAAAGAPSPIAAPQYDDDFEDEACGTEKPHPYVAAMMNIAAAKTSSSKPPSRQ